MTTEQLIQTLRTNHNRAAAFICSLPDEQFVNSHNGKWTPGQQLSHLILCLQPMSKALGSPAFIREKFGTIDRPTMDYEEVITKYKAGLQAGGRAPERFLPPVVDVSQREALQQELNEVLAAIQHQLTSYSEADLDTLALPHPFLGLLSIREFLYLMSYHPLHHLAQVERSIGVIS